MNKLFIFGIFCTLISSCSYKVYHNNTLDRKEIVPNLREFSYSGEPVYLVGNFDSIPKAASLQKAVTLHSPLFWSEASFESPYKLMKKYAIREANKLNCNIVKLERKTVSKHARFKLYTIMYKMDEPALSKYRHYLDSIKKNTLMPQPQPNKETQQDTTYKLLLKPHDKLGLTISAVSGAWIPTGDLKDLGVHPELGFRLGIKKRFYTGQLSFLFRFLDTPKPYLAKNTETKTWVETNTFTGAYVGIDLGANLYTQDNFELQALAGLGFEGITVLKDVYEDSKSQAVKSYNANLGLGFKYYFESQKYLGLESKYNVVDYSLGGITKLHGNFVSVRLVYGFLDWP